VREKKTHLYTKYIPLYIAESVSWRSTSTDVTNYCIKNVDQRTANFPWHPMTDSCPTIPCRFHAFWSIAATLSRTLKKVLMISHIETYFAHRCTFSQVDLKNRFNSVLQLLFSSIYGVIHLNASFIVNKVRIQPFLIFFIQRRISTFVLFLHNKITRRI
jgi:hypothetical protein